MAIEHYESSSVIELRRFRLLHVSVCTVALKPGKKYDGRECCGGASLTHVHTVTGSRFSYGAMGTLGNLNKGFTQAGTKVRSTGTPVRTWTS